MSDRSVSCAGGCGSSTEQGRAEKAGWRGWQGRWMCRRCLSLPVAAPMRGCGCDACRLARHLGDFEEREPRDDLERAAVDVWQSRVR